MSRNSRAPSANYSLPLTAWNGGQRDDDHHKPTHKAISLAHRGGLVPSWRKLPYGLVAASKIYVAYVPSITT